MARSGFGPLAVAIAVAAGVAIAPWLGPLGWAAWIVAAALVALVAWGGRILPVSLVSRLSQLSRFSRFSRLSRLSRFSRLSWLSRISRSGRHPAALLALGVAFGAARGARSPIAPPDGVVIDDRGADRVVGVVRGPVVQGPRGDGALIETDGAAIWLWAEQRLTPGERVAATGLVHTPRGLRDPGMPDRGDATRARGAELELTARSLERLGDEAGPLDLAWRWARATQARWTHAIDHAGGDPIGAAALRGIATGDRGDVPPALDQRWRTVGIFHVLSVSGLHLAVVAGLAFGVLRRLVAASPWGGRTRPARWAAPPALVLAIAYTMITGAQLATLRSLIVIALVLLGQLLDRPLRLIDALGLAALVILAWRPADLFDPSFQLSFVAALTLALRPAADHVRGVRGWLTRGFSTSAWVALTTAPITAFQFHQVAAGGVIGNLVLTPVVELVALPLGLAGVLIGAAPLIAIAAWLVGLADRGAGLLAEVTPVGHIAVAGATTMLVLVVLSVWIATRPRGPVRALAWLALCLVWSVGRTPPPAGALRVTFLDVGQGDAALLELPDGEVWLIDAGGNPSARDYVQASATGHAIDRVLAAYDHARIDLAILSHPHPDHYLGLAGLEAPIGELWSASEQIPVRSDLSPAARTTMPGFAAIAAALAARGTRLVHPALGLARTTAGVELTVWAPRYQPAAGAALACAADPVRTVNNNSLVVTVRYRGHTILFAGDVEAEGEDDLVSAGLGAVDVVKVPHHGSPTSSTPALVSATHPRLAVISCGPANSFGFPAADVVERWRAAGAEVARTDRDGAIIVTLRDDGSIDRGAP